ncbi:hypothetical protein FB561_6434 [Kribbella amoyensis]|uniref:Uncharacterized protein n=1 Tax=Kribbella amoyensis TaxID=996641 RepID=A0A561B877_9ACTN|nr:hypothetical protein [Kribbella amoyensis]TWD74999.1 hypothetical protein FB561_6434 [Kribbella amoyensis]
MIKGILIAESLRPGTDLAVPGLRLARLTRTDVSGSVVATQPTLWTLLHFEAADELADELAQALAGSLRPEDGWYADFTVGEDHVVVFTGKVFRYRRGDEAGRAEAVAYGRAAGTPEHQLDWGA